MPGRRHLPIKEAGRSIVILEVALGQREVGRQVDVSHSVIIR